MDDQKKLPELRFSGFEGEWEEYNLGDLFEITSASRVHKNEWTQSGVPFFRSSDVVADFKGIENKKAFISFELYKELSNKSGSVQANDLLVTGGGSIGIPYLIKSNDPFYFKDADLLWLRNGNKLNGYFLYNFFATTSFRSFINSITHIGTIAHYTIEQAKSTPIIIPHRTEQNKVGEFLLKLDQHLAHREQMHDKLINLKKAMLEKMFPKDGDAVPEIRFKEFKKDWKEDKLVDLCSLFSDGDWIESKDQSSNGIRLLQTGNVGVNEFKDKTDKSKWISEETMEALNCTEVLPGDILISRLPDPAGRACIVPNLDEKAITAVDCTIVRASDRLVNTFLIQYLSTNSYFNKVNNLLAGGTRQRISRSSLGEFIIKVPSNAEQKKIGNYFHNLDRLISKHQDLVTKLVAIKKACLEKLFV